MILHSATPVHKTGSSTFVVIFALKHILSG